MATLILFRLSLITLQDHEQLEVDSEDMVSAFNLFAVPEQWRGAFVFEKRVPGSVVAGGDPNVLIYVSIGTVPMGWVAAVDLIQQVARRIVFGMAKIPPELEVKSEGLFPHDGAWVLVYLDGLDVVRAVSGRSAAGSAAEAGRERLRDQFVDTCDNLKLPLNAGKRLVRALGGPVVGGEIDGVRGLLSHNRGKGLELFARYVAFLGEEHWTGQGLQQIVGYFSFACGFRRPLFSVLAETFAEATAYSPLVPFTPSDAAVLEILLSALLIPLAFTDLRASISRTISTSDASERAGAAAEATAFRAECQPRVQELAAAHAAEMNEETRDCHCGRQVAPGAGAPCPWSCAVTFCPWRLIPRAGVAIFLPPASPGWSWPLQQLGVLIHPSVPPRLLTVTFHPQVPCFRRRFPWKPGRLPGSSGTARRPGSPTSSMLSCEWREPASTWAVPERSFEMSPEFSSA